MITIIKTPRKVLSFVSRQYKAGIYVEVFECDENGHHRNWPRHTTVSGEPEEEFHYRLRYTALYRKHTILKQ
jgi:hypothetical protein